GIIALLCDPLNRWFSQVAISWFVSRYGFPLRLEMSNHRSQQRGEHGLECDGEHSNPSIKRQYAAHPMAEASAEASAVEPKSRLRRRHTRPNGRTLTV